MRMTTFACLGIFLATAAWAEPPPAPDDEAGILNPDDSGRDMLVRRIEMGITDPVTCSLGYSTVKYDEDLSLAMKMARICAEAGNVKAMTWMSQLEGTGATGKPDLAAATDWDRRAAETGDAVGRFNYGLSLLRGRGVARDDDLGRCYVDAAAKDGLEIAQRLQDADYDPDAVTPSADREALTPIY